MVFHWDYLNETVRKKHARQADQVGVFVLGVDNPDNAAAISRDVDNVFKNSLAETLTETEQAFQLGFVAMSNQIIAAIRVVSFVVIVIVMAVMANAMAMSARERITEYATLKALGFGPGFIAMLVFGESVVIATAGGALGMLRRRRPRPCSSRPWAASSGVHGVAATMALQAACAVVVGVAAALVPACRPRACASSKACGPSGRRMAIPLTTSRATSGPGA
jgi:putative ABC transport system permease protein